MKKTITDINNKVYLKEEFLKESNNLENNIIEVFPNEEITTFLGFGGAITESSAYNYQKLSKENRIKFLDDYYSSSGLNYSFGRLSIGSNDFSLKSFSYAKKKNLRDFNISYDQKYVIPLLKDILKRKELSLIASPWSPPKMYKKFPILNWGVKLSKKYYDSYSNYLVKYLEEYQKIGINIKYLTIQNEPFARQKWDSCVFSLLEQKEFIYKYLLPKLNKTEILLWDHNKDDLYNVFNTLYEKNKKIAGLAFHFYTGNHFEELKHIHEENPNILLINSEMCAGYSLYDEKKWISSAEYYLNDIIGDMNSGVNAYLDWNILLDEQGGPTPYQNYVKSILILKNNNYIKTPIYYYLYHISHFLKGEDIIINNKVFTKDLKVLAIKNKKEIITIIMNNSNLEYNYNLILEKKSFFDKIKPHSIVTYQMSLLK